MLSASSTQHQRITAFWLQLAEGTTIGSTWNIESPHGMPLGTLHAWGMLQFPFALCASRLFGSSASYQVCGNAAYVTQIKLRNNIHLEYPTSNPPCQHGALLPEDMNACRKHRLSKTIGRLWSGALGCSTMHCWAHRTHTTHASGHTSGQGWLDAGCAPCSAVEGQAAASGMVWVKGELLERWFEQLRGKWYRIFSAHSSAQKCLFSKPNVL
eukprot:363074-Chlamydomonas_euryale.AAC.7